MNILEVSVENIKENIEKYEWILLDIYEEGDVLSDIASATMKGLVQNISSKIKIIKVSIEEFKKAYLNNLIPNIKYDGYPEILLIRNGKLNVRIPCVCRVGKIVDILREKITF